MTYREPPPRFPRGLLMALGLMVGLGAAAYWLLPGATGLAALILPKNWEAQLGKAIYSGMTDGATACDDEVVARNLQAIIDRLAQAAPPHPYQFHITVVQDGTMNAFAAPGGYIVLHTGLLEVTTAPEELAGVLAHEMQHVLRQHGVQALFREISSGLLVSAVMGDAGGAMDMLLEGAKTLDSMHYSRSHEAEADRLGLAMMQAAHINPQGMIRLFQKLHEAEALQPQVPTYLSSHPATTERLAALRRAAKASTGHQPIPLQGEDDWKALTQRCRPQ